MNAMPAARSMLIGIVALLVASTAAATSIVAGPNLSGTSATTSGLTLGTTLGAPSESVQVTYDASAGPWIKTFSIPTGTNGPIVSQLEWLTLQAGVTGWYVQLLSAPSGVHFAGTQGFSITGSPAPGLMTTVTDTSVSFSFDPLSFPAPPVPTPSVAVNLSFGCLNNQNWPTCLSGSDYTLTLAQYPMQSPIPEPSTSLLVVAGLGLLGTMLRRRTR